MSSISQHVSSEIPGSGTRCESPQNVRVQVWPAPSNADTDIESIWTDSLVILDLRVDWSYIILHLQMHWLESDIDPKATRSHFWHFAGTPGHSWRGSHPHWYLSSDPPRKKGNRCHSGSKDAGSIKPQIPVKHCETLTKSNTSIMWHHFKESNLLRQSKA